MILANLYLGSSRLLSSDEVIARFDIDFAGRAFRSAFERPLDDQVAPDEVDGKDGDFRSVFQKTFAGGRIEPGDFEVYGREDFPGLAFDAALFLRLLPFTPDPRLVAQIDFTAARSVFYVKTQGLMRTEDEGITLFGPMRIGKFVYE
ncbi:hypothetical protein NX862_05840 [Rhodobacter sp. KR11]|uniref:hypothetical protein n=1 Tax=Rhodobacter sp. KR11 TaxID=2974588 RepID=UPI0022214CE0|nr:hypothetical protein [Rhodobacter sp. KR11]MCW1918265.1 hypothetical protein [Rhodobacter sp. KR11]